MIVNFENGVPKEHIYHTWVHFLGAAGLFFAGLAYWIFASSYLKTSLILKKLLRKMKLEIYNPRVSNDATF